jgi:hypothetical protein
VPGSSQSIVPGSSQSIVPGSSHGDELGRRFYDNIQLQAEIHYTGALGASLFCESYASASGSGDYARAFVLAWMSKEAFKKALEGFRQAEHGIWGGYYRNDCLTDVALTVQFLEKLQGWLRIKGEGANFHMWHRKYLMEEKDRRIAMILYTNTPLSDDELAARLCKQL